MSMQRAKGFTLLEILVAMFIFAILSAVVVSALYNITTQAQRTQKTADRLSEFQFALIHFSNSTLTSAEKQFALPKAIKISFVTKDFGTISQLYLIPAQTIELQQPGEQGESAE